MFDSYTYGFDELNPMAAIFLEHKLRFIKNVIYR